MWSCVCESLCINLVLALAGCHVYCQAVQGDNIYVGHHLLDGVWQGIDIKPEFQQLLGYQGAEGSTKWCQCTKGIITSLQE